MKQNDLLIFVPTYNEAENVERLLVDISALDIQADILFIDDNSPDGTGAILDRLAAHYSNLTVIHRSGKNGIGSAHLDGIRYAYQQGYVRLVTMDSDFTHSPENIFDLLRESEHSDIVVGSRYLQKDSLIEWNLFRTILTKSGHILTENLLKMPYDATGAFRLYRLDTVPFYAFQVVRSLGYAFFFESLYIMHLNGYRIREIPIALPARTYGHSKMTIREAFRSVKQLMRIYANTLFNRSQFDAVEPFVPSGETLIPDNQGWDDYWSDKDAPGGIVYNAIAAFYRRFIIKPALNHFIFKHFQRGASILHAGCGSGQVDTDVHTHVSVTALDISAKALTMYKRANKGIPNERVVQANIFSLPFADATIDGIYNLGVIEHFSEEDIHKILREFRRVLKHDGKVIIFWPPTFGVTTNFLDFVHFVLNRILKKNIQLHPDEISRLQSREFARALCEPDGYTMIDYYFGLRDLGTQAVVVLQRA
jgi:dolichol-phosphate mannosyltransferase